jgi:hypothetical protein
MSAVAARPSQTQAGEHDARGLAATTDIDPTRTLASISYCSSDARFSLYESTLVWADTMRRPSLGGCMAKQLSGNYRTRREKRAEDDRGKAAKQPSRAKSILLQY